MGHLPQNLEFNKRLMLLLAVLLLVASIYWVATTQNCFACPIRLVPFVESDVAACLQTSYMGIRE